MLELLWIKSLFDFAAFLLGGLFVLYLKTKYPRPTLFTRVLMIWLTCKIIIDFLGFIQYTSWLQNLFELPWRLSDVVIFFQLCFAPLLYFSCRAAGSGRFTFQRQHWWHALPALIYALGWMVDAEGMENIRTKLLFLVEGHFIVYAILSWRTVVGDTRLGQLLKTVLVGMLLWRSIRAIEYLLWLQLQWITEPEAWGLYILSEVTFLGILGYFFLKLIQQPNIMPGGQQWLLSHASRQKIKKGLRSLIEMERVYLDPLLSLDRLAKALHVPPHYLSQYLNREMKMTFNEWVNAHRIEECKRLISDPNQQDATIQSLMYQAGFNSKSTFHTAFKKSTGMTPTQYRKRMLLSNG